MKNRYEIDGDVTKIYMNYKGNEMVTIIDTADLEKVNSITGSWRPRKALDQKNKFYVYSSVYIKKSQEKLAHYKHFALSRFLMDFPEGLVVDHINDDSLDNRKSVNLQAISNGDNVRKQKRFQKNKAV